MCMSSRCRHMYRLERLKYPKLTVGTSIVGLVASSVGTGIFAIKFQQARSPTPCPCLLVIEPLTAHPTASLSLLQNKYK